MFTYKSKGGQKKYAWTACTYKKISRWSFYERAWAGIFG